MRRDTGDLDERFAAFVREHGERHLRVAVLLTGNWHAAEDLVQASLVKLCRAWPRLDTSSDPDSDSARLRSAFSVRLSAWVSWHPETVPASPFSRAAVGMHS